MFSEFAQQSISTCNATLLPEKLFENVARITYFTSRLDISFDQTHGIVLRQQLSQKEQYDDKRKGQHFDRGRHGPSAK